MNMGNSKTQRMSTLAKVSTVEFLRNYLQKGHSSATLTGTRFFEPDIRVSTEGMKECGDAKNALLLSPEGPTTPPWKK